MYNSRYGAFINFIHLSHICFKLHARPLLDNQNIIMTMIVLSLLETYMSEKQIGK